MGHYHVKTTPRIPGGPATPKRAPNPNRQLLFLAEKSASIASLSYRTELCLCVFVCVLLQPSLIRGRRARGAVDVSRDLYHALVASPDRIHVRPLRRAVSESVAQSPPAPAGHVIFSPSVAGGPFNVAVWRARLEQLTNEP